MTQPDQWWVTTDETQSSELQDIFSAAPPTPNGSLMASAKVKNAYLRATGAGGDETAITQEVAKEVEAMDAAGRK